VPWEQEIHPAPTGIRLQVLAQFLSTKQGLANADSSDDPVYIRMADHFEQNTQPAIRQLYEAAVGAGQAKPGFEPTELLAAVFALCTPGYDRNPGHVRAIPHNGQQRG